MHRTTNYLLISLLFLMAGPALAQEEETERWFKVELMIFSHEIANNSSEQWEATPALAYPGEARFLVEPSRVDANLAEHRAESVVDEFGRQILTLLPEPEKSSNGLGRRGSGRQPEEMPPPSAEQPGATDADQPQRAPTTPTPFVALPASDRTFYGKAAYMQRSGRYRTLFHQAWYQPVIDERDALPIVIDRSGDTGEWPRLQGSVKLHLSRYLHIETNLWLNTDGRYLSGEWHMPAPPLGPPSLIIEDPAPPELVDPGLPPAESALDPNEMIEESGPQYPWRHAVLLQQKRRMRSTEVHYLDHPLLGVVVTFTPVTGDELEALALAEAGLAPEADTTAHP